MLSTFGGASLTVVCRSLMLVACEWEMDTRISFIGASQVSTSDVDMASSYVNGHVTVSVYKSKYISRVIAYCAGVVTAIQLFDTAVEYGGLFVFHVRFRLYSCCCCHG